MTLLQDGILAFFSAVGMTTVVWLLSGALLHAGRPTVPGLLLVLPLKGPGTAAGGQNRAGGLRHDGGCPGAGGVSRRTGEKRGTGGRENISSKVG